MDVAHKRFAAVVVDSGKPDLNRRVAIIPGHVDGPPLVVGVVRRVRVLGGAANDDLEVRRPCIERLLVDGEAAGVREVDGPGDVVAAAGELITVQEQRLTSVAAVGIELPVCVGEVAVVVPECLGTSAVRPE